MGLVFGPLLWTASVLSQMSLSRWRGEEAGAIGRAVGQAALSTPGSLAPLVKPPVVGIQRQLAQVPERIGPEPPNGLTQGCQAKHGVLWCVTEAGTARATVGVAPRASDRHSRSLTEVMGLYFALLAVALTLGIYWVITALIVRPLDALRAAAHRVAEGSRQFSLPVMPAKELALLGQSIKAMTNRLLEEETELRGRIEEVNEKSEHLRQAQDRLVRSERLASVGRLAAGLAHEIGNPIAAVMGFQELLLQGGLSPEESRDFLQRMQRETERIHRILRDLLDFARPSAHGIRAGEPGDVTQAIHEACDLVRPQKGWKSLELVLELAPHLELVSLERERIVQLLLNLLLNAGDAVGETGKIVLRAEPSQLGVKLSVTDDGPGVASEVRARLFEPFVSTKEVGKGTGLGLAVCRGLVEGVGGRISLEEKEGSGACFVCELPRAALSDQDSASLRDQLGEANRA